MSKTVTSFMFSFDDFMLITLFLNETKISFSGFSKSFIPSVLSVYFIRNRSSKVPAIVMNV